MSRTTDKVLSLYYSAIKILVFALALSNIGWLVCYSSNGSYYKKLYEECDRSKGCWSYEIQYLQKIEGEYQTWKRVARDISPLYDNRKLANLMLSRQLDNEISEVIHPTMRIAIITNFCEETIDTVDIIRVDPR